MIDTPMTQRIANTVDDLPRSSTLFQVTIETTNLVLCSRVIYPPPQRSVLLPLIRLLHLPDGLLALFLETSILNAVECG